MDYVIDFAKVTSKGQITIPIDIRKRLDLQPGDHVAFVEVSGRVLIDNAYILELPDPERKLQRERLQVRLEVEEPVWQAWKTKKDREPGEED